MKHDPLPAPLTRQDLSDQLYWLAEHMKDIGVSMEYYGGFDRLMAMHSEELMGAAEIVTIWADEIKEQT